MNAWYLGVEYTTKNIRRLTMWVTLSSKISFAKLFTVSCTLHSACKTNPHSMKNQHLAIVNYVYPILDMLLQTVENVGLLEKMAVDL